MKLTLFLFSLFAALGVLAHPGGLDANGGHMDRKTGIYHFHRGTNTPSGTATNVSSTDSATNRMATETSPVESNHPEAGVASTLRRLPWWIYLLGLGGGYAIWETACYFCHKKNTKR
jgi:hypothetical protein